MTHRAPIDLPGGLVLREAQPGDIDPIVEQNVTAFGPQEGPEVRTYLERDPGPEGWTVVTEDDQVISSVGGLRLRLRLDGVALPTYQIEYVVTDPRAQRRGLVRAQVDWHHRRAAELGDLVTTIGGIPYFYRRLGYGYGFDHPRLFVFDPGAVRADDDVLVRDATADDLDALAALEALRPLEGLRIERDRTLWSTVLRLAAVNPCAHLLVAEVGGEVRGWARLFDHPHDDRMSLLPSVASTPPVAATLVRAALDRAGDHLLVAFDSPGTAFSEVLHEHGHGFELGHGFYARIPDPVAVLDRLRPVLSERLSRSRFAGDDGEIDISLYVVGVRLRYAGGVVTAVEPAPPLENPLDGAGIGVAPDWFPALVFGRWGASTLAARVDDVLLGPHAGIMDVLFPWRPADVAGDF